MNKFTADSPNPFFNGKSSNEVGRNLQQAIDHMITPEQHDCPYCHYPYKTFRNGEKLVPPTHDSGWWGLMPRFNPKRIGTIMKINKCPACGRKLGVGE